MNSEQDKLCIEQLKLGSEAALKKLFDTYYMPLCLYAMQITDSLEVAEDLAQEVFISFWERKAFHLLTSDIKHYLFAAIRNLSLNYMKRERPYALQDMEEAIHTSEYCRIIENDSMTPDDEAIRLKQKLNKALKELTPQEHNVLRAIIFENKKYKEVAEELQISINSVKTLWARALKKLRSQSLLLTLISLYY